MAETLLFGSNILGLKILKILKLQENPVSCDSCESNAQIVRKCGNEDENVSEHGIIAKLF